MSLDSIKRKINIKYFMVVYLSSLLIAGAYVTQGSVLFSHITLNAESILFFYCFFDLTLTYIKEKTLYLPLSSLISALILALISGPVMPWRWTLLLPLLAVLSKHFLKFGKLRHVFNPAAFALFIASFFIQTSAWWGMSWGVVPLYVISGVGIFILWRQSRWNVTLSFLAGFTCLYSAILIFYGANFTELFYTAGGLIFNGTTLFLASVMLIEPVTSNFPLSRQRAIYGLLSGFFAAASILFIMKFPNSPFAPADPLIFGLLLGNMTASLLFLPNNKTQYAKTD